MTGKYSIDVCIDINQHIISVILCLTLCSMAILSMLWYMGVI